MRLFYCDHFVLPLPEGHRFPMEKYALLRARVESDLPPNTYRLSVPEAASDRELETVHTREYLNKVIEGSLSEAEVRRIGFPWSPTLVGRSRRSVGGTIECARAALEDGVAANLSGGTHHAFPDRGEGYCVFNDVAVAARLLLDEGVIGSAAILDTDVHQGNGTAYIFRNSPEVFTLSTHGANNYPFRKEPGDLDLELLDEAGDEQYLEAVEVGLDGTLGASKPDLAFFLSGADPFHGDRLGRLAVSKKGLLERDRMVLNACRDARVPAAIVMGGGYAEDVRDTVDIHFETVRIATTLAGGQSNS